MKTLGLIGGMSWESTVPYYRIINETVREALGGHHSAPLVLYSVDFHDIEALQQAGDWDAMGERLGEIARRLEGAGAEVLILCTNTMHRVAPAIEAAAPEIPLLHIADATAAAAREKDIRRVGLLGTRFTMEGAFYRERLQDRHELEVLVPDASGREAVHRMIYDELVHGEVREASRERFRGIIATLADRGAEAVILGCTEISMLVGSEDADLPLLDTMEVHAEAAARVCLEDEEAGFRRPN
jgi:aspartate racemase